MTQTPVLTAYYLDGVVIEGDFLFLATQLEAIDPESTLHTRMVSYRPGAQELPFGGFDIGDNIVSIHGYRVLPDDKMRYACLGRHGTVHFFRGSTGELRPELIPGAGLLSGNLGGLMTHLRQIGPDLWACGQRGQVYRRFGRDDWRHVDQGLFEPLNAADYTDRAGDLAMKMIEGPMLQCMDGSSPDNVYVVGLRGLVAHFDGKAWRKLEVPTDEHLQWVRCYGPDEVWACGFNGTLLKGNARQGFKDQSSVDDNQTWVCLSKYNGQVYLSAEEGLHVFDGKKIAPVKTKLKPELQDAWRVDHADGVLWSIGVKDLARFDGKKWQRIDHPDNPAIR